MKTWFDEAQKLAEEGRAASQIELGNSYLTGFDPTGNTFSRDFTKARQWLERAHERGSFTATHLLGTMYEDGKGVTPDVEKAIQLYKKAAASGAFYSCVNLARIFARGTHVPQSSAMAAEWYQKVLSYESRVDDGGEMDEARKFLDEHQSRSK